MIVIVSGSRGYHQDDHLPKLDEAIRLSGFRPTRIIHGDNMQSVDRLARRWAKLNNIPDEGIPADWDEARRLGVPVGAMGPIRNGKLEKKGQALVAVWDGVTPGTKDMIEKMRRAGKPGFVYRLDGAPHYRINAQLALL